MIYYLLLGFIIQHYLKKWYRKTTFSKQRRLRYLRQLTGP